MKDILFGPRHLPGWWERFTEAHPALPTLVALSGLGWICYSLSQIVVGAQVHGHGQLIETLEVVSGSESLVSRAIGLRDLYHHYFPAEVRNLVASLYGNLALYLVIPFLWLLEVLFPCRPSQPLIGRGFLQDAVWFVVIGPTRILVLFPMSELLRRLFEHQLAFLTVDAAADWPLSIQITLALLATEFLRWLSHYARHRVHALWLFHAIHHSQEEINVFTDDRVHIVDLVVLSLLTFIPFLVFRVPDFYTLSIIGLYLPIHNRFVHANVKINLGWLGWLIASPQFHRVHHSADLAHANTNYGVYLSAFDYLFGTAYPCRDIYPETGIGDPGFPNEGKLRVRQLAGNWLAQTLYPFTQLKGTNTDLATATLRLGPLDETKATLQAAELEASIR